MATEINETILENLKKEGFKDLEIDEIALNFYNYTGYPKPNQRYKLTYINQDYSVEEMYFWMVGHARDVLSLPYSIKITDIFAASEGSSLFGDLGQRLTAMQNQASSLLATTNNMVKDLFKKVRDFRKMRERLSYYKKVEENLPSNERKSSTAHAAENTLKDLWITLIEGGGENPSSVYGMATKVNFVTLPDLFFQAPPLKENEIKDYVKDLDFNPAVLLALERKLYQFYHWKKGTYEELKFKENMLKKNIYQHYQNIRLYLNWIKPYIKNANKLSVNSDMMDTYGIISSFQTSMVEIETLLYVPVGNLTHPTEKKDLTVNSVVVLHFLYQTTPEMNFHAKDSYHQKGPSHAGRVDCQIRTYSWTSEEISAYKKAKTDEEFEIIKALDNSLTQDVDYFGSDLKELINEIEEELGLELSGDQSEKEKEKTLDEKKKERDEKIKSYKKSQGGPVSDIFRGFKEILIEPFFSGSSKNPQKQMLSYNSTLKGLKKKATSDSNAKAWLIYKNYKKAHKMVTW